MQSSLNLKTHDIPENFPVEAKKMCRELVDEVDKTHSYYKEQIEFLKQRYKIAVKQLRPGMITVQDLNALFDEVEMTAEPETEPEIEDPQNKAAKKDKKKHRNKKKKAIPDHLPRTIVKHDVSEEEKTCPKDGSPLSPMGYDVREELKYIPGHFEVTEHQYPKYSCKTCREGVLRQPPEPTLIPKSYASASLLAHIAVSKFTNHLPLYRLEQMFSREGVHISPPGDGGLDDQARRQPKPTHRHYARKNPRL